MLLRLPASTKRQCLSSTMESKSPAAMSSPLGSRQGSGAVGGAKGLRGVAKADADRVGRETTQNELTVTVDKRAHHRQCAAHLDKPGRTIGAQLDSSADLARRAQRDQDAAPSIRA